tara:strand:+ start:224 stop:532 length:309 start_codon:yes stop_codon:yes gene_type:complete
MTYKLKYKNSAFPFKTEPKPKTKTTKIEKSTEQVKKLEESLKTPKSKEGVYPIVNINPETLSVGGGYTKGRFSIGGGYSKRLGGSGGGFGGGIRIKFGGKKK